MLSGLLADLAAYSPTLAGTFPLGLQIEGSDLDLLCSAPDLDDFEAALRAALARHSVRLQRLERLSLSPEASVASVAWEGPLLEIFCQAIPVCQQQGFRHMVVEGRLLVAGGPRLRERVLAAKRGGLKTEPAFASVLGLPGDPYAALLELERWSWEELRALVEAVERDAKPTSGS